MAKFEGQEIPSWKELGIDPGESQLLECFFPMISPLDDRQRQAELFLGARSFLSAIRSYLSTFVDDPNKIFLHPNILHTSLFDSVLP